MCMDADAAKIAALRSGQVPFFEPGLTDMVSRGVESGALQFTSDAGAAVAHGHVQFIAVGTPPDENGAADLQHVLSVADSIGSHMEASKVVVVKSTVPVGTCEKVAERLRSALAARGSGHAFEVVSNPEFLKEGAAIADFQKPDRIIVGANGEHAREVMAELYQTFNRNHDRIMYMDVRSAEMTKYAANAMLATKISFINEMANLAERLGADIEAVRRGIGSDPRIGYHFIYPGLGFGGSCFPKDVQALVRTAREVGYEAEMIKAVEAVNDRQKRRMFARIAGHFGGEPNLRGKTFALWGLSFKPNTDDMREAPSRVLLEQLHAAGATVRAFDPVALDETLRLYGERPDLVLCRDKYSVLDGADALVICTEWQQFRAPDFEEMKTRLNSPLIFDGRNLYTPQRLRDDGWTYYSIGRAPAFPRPQAIEQQR